MAVVDRSIIAPDQTTDTVAAASCARTGNVTLGVTVNDRSFVVPNQATDSRFFNVIQIARYVDFGIAVCNFSIAIVRTHQAANLSG